MLPYFRKYLALAFAGAALVPTVVTGVWFLLTGVNAQATLPGLIATLVLFFGSAVWLLNYFNRRAEADVDRLISLYNDGCDPVAFVNQIAPIAGRVGSPNTEQGAWLLSYYALALADTAKVQAASQIAGALRRTAAVTEDKGLAASILVDVEPVVLKTSGVFEALDVVATGEQLLDAIDAPEDDGKRVFLATQRQLLDSLAADDQQELIACYRRTWENDASPLRVRVESACHEADIQRDRGNAAAEKECLAFAVAHGNRLPEIPQAKDRLAVLEDV